MAGLGQRALALVNPEAAAALAALGTAYEAGQKASNWFSPSRAKSARARLTAPTRVGGKRKIAAARTRQGRGKFRRLMPEIRLRPTNRRLFEKNPAKRRRLSLRPKQRNLRLTAQEVYPYQPGRRFSVAKRNFPKPVPMQRVGYARRRFGPRNRWRPVRRGFPLRRNPRYSRNFKSKATAFGRKLQAARGYQQRLQRSRYRRPQNRGRRGPRRGFAGLPTYTTGLPLSRTVIIKAKCECLIKTAGLSWGLLPLEMNNPLDPFKHAKVVGEVGTGATLQAAGLSVNHRFLEWTDLSGNVTVMKTIQPQGWDQLWGGNFDRHEVLESQATITIIPTDPQGTDRCRVGFIKGHYILDVAGTLTADGGGNRPDIPTFEEKYINVHHDNGLAFSQHHMMENPQFVTVGGSDQALGGPKVFMKRWAQGQTKAKVHYAKNASDAIPKASWIGTQTANSVIRPVTYLCARDLGTTSSATLQCTVEMKYKIRLFKNNEVIPIGSFL